MWGMCAGRIAVGVGGIVVVVVLSRKLRGVPLDIQGRKHIPQYNRVWLSAHTEILERFLGSTRLAALDEREIA